MITKEEAVKAYEDLIQLRRSEVLEKDKSQLGQIEIHHILPTSCGGEDVEYNKIALYAKEHFMAHVYLWVIHHDDEFHYQTMCALNNMIKGTVLGDRTELRDFILASEEYQKAKEEFAKYNSETIGSKISGEKNGAYGKHWYYDPVTLNCSMFFDTEVPNGYVFGRKIKDLNEFSEKVSNSFKGRRWIRRKDLTKQSLVDVNNAEYLLLTGEWEYGKIPRTPEQNEIQKLKTFETQLKNGTRNAVKDKRLFPVCLNCGKDNPNKYAQCCCDECKKEYDRKRFANLLEQKHLNEAQILKEQGYFDAQTTSLYEGVVNRKQVRRYLEVTGHTYCNKCGKTDVKLIVHAIDGNCRNLSIDNYEFLCHECYVNSGTAGFSNKSIKQINARKVSLQ